MRRIDPAALSLQDRREIAVVLGSGGGPIEFSERMYHLYYTNQVKKASVYAIPSGTIGTLSSELSMRFGLRGAVPRRLDRVHLVDRRDRLRVPHDPIRPRAYGARGRRGRHGRARDHGGVRDDADRVDGVGTGAGRGRRVPSRRTATASCSAKAHGCSCSKTSSAPDTGAPASTPRSAAMARPAMRTTGCASTRPARSRPAP